MADQPLVPRHRWKTPLLAALVVANAALGVSLVADVLPGTTAHAQQAGPPSDYLMVPANLGSANQQILYVVDTRSGDMTAVAFQRQGGISFTAPLRLGQTFQNFGR